MDHQSLSSVTNDSLCTGDVDHGNNSLCTGDVDHGNNGGVSQKHNNGTLSPVIDLRPVDAGIRPISDEIQQDMQGVGRQLHEVVGGELQLTSDDIHRVGEDHHVGVGDLAVSNDHDPLAIEPSMDNNQHQQAITHQGNMLGDKSLKLPFPSQGGGRDEREQQVLQLGMNNNGGGGGGGLIPDTTQHYYHTLHQAPIMVYEVPSGNLVPFDSLVPVPLAKGIEEKNNTGVDLLQASVNEAVYTQASHEMSHSLYVLHPQKKESDGMVIGQISGVSGAGGGVAGVISSDGVAGSNIVLENREGFNKVSADQGMMPIGTEFSLISTSCYENSVTTVANMAQLSMSAVYQSSETDSEVALTLASLGNPKIEKLRELPELERIDRQNQGPSVQNGVPSDVMRTASIITGISEQYHEKTSGLNAKKDKPTLVLRSRKNKGGGGTQGGIHGPAGNIEENKKGRRKKKREKILAKSEEVTTEEEFILPDHVLSVETTCIDMNAPTTAAASASATVTNAGIQNESQKENLLGQLLKASEHCEPATLIPEGVVDDVIPAVGYRIMDMSNLSEMIRMMHRCSGSMGAIVIQEQASLREGAVSQLSVICTGCQEGAVCATSNTMNNTVNGPWDINARVQQLTKEFSVTEEQVRRMLEILGIFYRPRDPALQPMPHPAINDQPPQPRKRKRKKKTEESPGKAKNIVCSVCKERFVGANHLKKHMHSHDLSLHTCPYCHAYFKKPFNLKQHIRKHENVKYECKHCQREFTDKSTLQCHIKSQHEKRYDIVCEFCLKRFYHRAHYNEHKRIHTGERPYMCEICGKKFSWHDSVKKHMQTHSAESKYKCRLCGKWFRWLQGVRQHLQQQHKLKKSDIEAQVVTAATETATAMPYTTQQLQHSQQQQQILEDGGAREYHTLEAAAVNNDNTQQQQQQQQQETLDIFHVQVDNQHQDMFQYH